MIVKRVVGSKGQVVIPKDIREQLGVKPGSEIIFEVEGNRVTLKPRREPEDIVEEYVSVITPKLKEKVQLEQIIEEEALEEIELRGQ